MPSFVVGIVLALVIAWVWWPIQFTNADPSDLRVPLKEDYIRMTGAAYELSGDLKPARTRIQALGLADASQVFNDLIAREQQHSQSSVTRDALIHLGQALGFKSPYTAERPAPNVPAPVAVYVVATPAPVVPTFQLVEHAQLGCTEAPDAGRIAIVVKDSAGNEMPNIGIEIRSGDSIDTIYTGLKPERGVGYADYEAAPGTFSVRILNAESETVSALLVGQTPPNCRADRGATPRGWNLVFQQK